MILLIVFIRAQWQFAPMNRIPRIFTHYAPQHSPAMLLEGDNAHYLLNVLRVKPGQALELFDGSGQVWPAMVTEKGRRDLTLAVDAPLSVDHESPLHLTLELAITKGERFEWALQKATELGVTCIQPVISERAEARLSGDRQSKRDARWRNIVISACEQSKRAVLPELLAPCALTDLPALTPGQVGLVLAPGREPSWPAQSNGPVRALIGPEGGLSDDEVDWAITRGYQGIGLGSRILRAETAAVAVATLCQSRYGDLG